MHILLTGASGFIGGHFLRTFLDAGHEVTIPLRPKSISKVNVALSGKLHILEGDFYDPHLYDEAPTPDVVVHLASIRGAGNCEDVVYRRVNVAGTKTLLDFAVKRSVPRFVYCSSVGVLGTIPERLPASAHDTPHPDGIYHQTKYESEQLVNAAPANLKTIILRPTITYGRGDDGFVPKMLTMTLKKQLLLPGKNIKIHLLHVDAFAAFTLQLLGQKKWARKIYHVADKNPVVLKEIVDTISLTLIGKPYPGWLRFPAIGYQAAALALGWAGMDGLKTSVELIGKSWYYDIFATETDLHYRAVETLSKIKEMIKNG